MTVRLEPKRADEVRNYRHDWAAFLGEDTIASQTTTSDDVTISNDAIDDTAVEWRVSGGTDGAVATILQTIVTAAGLTEKETFALPISLGEPIRLSEVKDVLRVTHDDEDAKIAAMIPRARAWVEDYTGTALVRRQFTELRRTENGGIRLFKGPLVSVDSVTYGEGETYTPRTFVPDTRIVAAVDSAWPALDADDAFEIVYTAGVAEGEVDDRLIGAMLALIEGEYAEGYAYPPRAVEAAERCCGQLRQVFV